MSVCQIINIQIITVIKKLLIASSFKILWTLIIMVLDNDMNKYILQCHHQLVSLVTGMNLLWAF